VKNLKERGEEVEKKGEEGEKSLGEPAKR